MTRRKIKTREMVGSEYLYNILTNWNSFCKGHRKVTESIKAVIMENEALKCENTILKAQLKNIQSILNNI